MYYITYYITYKYIYYIIYYIIIIIMYILHYILNCLESVDLWYYPVNCCPAIDFGSSIEWVVCLSLASCILIC